MFDHDLVDADVVEGNRTKSGLRDNFKALVRMLVSCVLCEDSVVSNIQENTFMVW